MKFVITVLIINFVFILNNEAAVNHFFIEENKVKCALLDLDADLLINYETTKGNKSATLGLSTVPGNQAGICSNKPTVTEVLFNISVSSTEVLTFNFRNINNLVELTSIGFQYQTPNSDFPDAKNNETVYGLLNSSIILSNISEYYECNSLVQFKLTNGINLRVVSAKIKVFDVKNNSFGQNKKECTQLTSTIKTTKRSTTKHSTTKHSTTEPSTTQTTKHSTTEPSTTQTTKHSTTEPSTTQTTKHSTTESSTTQTTKHSTTEPSTTQTTKHSTTEPSTTQTTNHLTSKSSSHYTKSSMSSTKLSTRTPYVTTTASQKTGMFYVNDTKTGNICLLLKSQLSISIKYTLENNKTGNTAFDILSNAKSAGICEPTEDVLALFWHSGLMLIFIFTKEDGYSSLSRINLTYYTSEKYFPNATNQNVFLNETQPFKGKCKMSLKSYYTCSALNFDIGKNAKLTLKDFKYEAFRKSTTKDFSNQEVSCDSKSPLVAIIVGVVLAAFLILVVVIFLIFRYRAQKTKGYEEI